MKINLDDPNLTAFALGELSPTEHAKMAEAIASSPEAQSFVAETQQLARLLRAEYEADRRVPAPRSPIMVRMEEERRSSSRYQWGSLAAALAIFAVLGALAVSTIQREQGTIVQKKPSPRTELSVVEAVSDDPAENKSADTFGKQNYLALQLPPAPTPEPRLTVPPEVIDGFGAVAGMTNFAALGEDRPESSEPNLPSRYRQDFNTATYDKVEENSFLPAATNPLSTFSIDVDTASYSNVRRFINNGSLPPKDAVRVEEMINYFSYDYREPEGDKPFSIDLDSTECPWDTSHRLLRIGLKGREVANEKRPASNLVFLLDVSGSMLPAERLPLVKQAMRLLVDKLSEKDRVAIVVYAGGSGLALNSTSGNEKEKIQRALEELKAGGSTNGAEGIELAYKVAADNFIKGGVNRVILATDGDFNIGVTN
ncbi:MAG TPA: von Willebrand factor type A domain-containing protein, partial [Chthoniobacterales bacterium]